jgi:hypothetical protein
VKLDPRIEHPYFIMTPFEEDCKGIVGEYCAFANDIETFKNLDDCTFGTLKRFSGDENFPFEFEVTVSHRTATAKFCLPYYQLKKTWRPFKSIGEFLEKHPLGSVLRYSDGVHEKVQMFTEYWQDSNGDYIKLGGELMTFEELFALTLKEGEEAHPFGVDTTV